MKKLSIILFLICIIGSCKTKNPNDITEEDKLRSDLERCFTKADLSAKENNTLKEQNELLQTHIKDNEETIHALISERESLAEEYDYLSEVNHDLEVLKKDFQLINDSLQNVEYDLIQTSAYLSQIATVALNEPIFLDTMLTYSLNDIPAMYNRVENKILQDRVYFNLLKEQKLDTISEYKMIQGDIAIYCPTEMIYKQTYDVKSIIPDLISDEAIRETMVQAVLQHNPDMTEETLNDDVLIEKIEYHNLVELELKEIVENTFLINPMHSDNRQKVSSDMRGWHWKVTPISEDKEQQLFMNAYVFNANGERLYEFDKTFKINVDVDLSGFPYKVKKLIVDEPKWAVVTLAIPFLSFLVGRLTIKKKKPSEDT